MKSLEIWTDLVIRRSRQTHIRFMKNRGLSGSQIITLFHLTHRGPCGVSTLAEHLSVTNAAISQQIDRMVKQGLVTRSEDPNDRRLKQLVITPLGQEIVDDSRYAQHSWLKGLSALMTEGERTKVEEALDILIEKTNQLDEPIDQEA